jgi:hypothetical protein
MGTGEEKKGHHFKNEIHERSMHQNKNKVTK